jgi:hypothetical protein
MGLGEAEAGVFAVECLIAEDLLALYCIGKNVGEI